MSLKGFFEKHPAKIAAVLGAVAGAIASNTPLVPAVVDALGKLLGGQ